MGPTPPIFCTVHIQRGLQQKFSETDALPLMQELLTATSKIKCENIFQALLNHSDQHVQPWAEHKKISWILSGINRCYSKMQPAVFDSYQKNPNLIESTHHYSNLDGIGVSLLTAIQQYVSIILNTLLLLVVLPDTNLNSLGLEV